MPVVGQAGAIGNSVLRAFIRSFRAGEPARDAPILPTLSATVKVYDQFSRLYFEESLSRLLLTGAGYVTESRRVRLSYMKLSDDLPVSAMYGKAVLFGVAGAVAGATLLIELPTLRTAFLLAVCVWSFCRLYYFFFYVIERYIDPRYRFDSIGSALRYLWSRRRE